MKFEQILELVNAVSESKVTAFEYKEGDTKLSLMVEPSVVKSGTSVITEIASVPPVIQPEVVPDISGNVVSSPLVGTYYSAASEEAEAFVKVGDKVTKGQTLAIVEAMKLMNEIESDYEGIVEEILVNNAQGVEYGQPLFVIR